MKARKKRVRSDRANAFVTEPETGQGPKPDDLAEFLGENFISSATGGEDGDEVLHEDLELAELGGPFIQTAEEAEFAGPDDKDDARNPGEPEAFPTAIRSGRPPLSPIVRHRHS